MPIEWTPALAVGIDEIDNQHKEIFRRIRDLTSASGLSESKRKTKDILSYLGKYVVIHFALEERFMAAASFSGLQAHRVEHQTLTAQYEHFRQQLAQSGNSAADVMRIQLWLNRWLIRHIGETDRRMAEFLTLQNRIQSFNR